MAGKPALSRLRSLVLGVAILAGVQAISQDPESVSRNAGTRAVVPSDARTAAREELDTAFGGGNEAAILEACRRHRAHLRGYEVGFETPLVWAARKGAVNLIRFLLEAGLGTLEAEPDRKRMQTPLNAALRFGQSEAVRVLLEGGADPNEAGEMERVPLLELLSRVQAPRPASPATGDLLRTLLQSGANVLGPATSDPATDLLASARIWAPLPWLEFALTNARPEFQASPTWNTLVHAAASLGATNTLPVLLARGIPATATNRHGRHALHEVARQRTEPPALGASAFAPRYRLRHEGRALSRETKRRTAEMLVGAGARLDVFAAAGLGDLACLEAEHRKDPRAHAARDREQQTPLHWAVLGDEPGAVEWLAARGADLSARDAEGNTPLHLALGAWPNQVVPVLLQRGAPVTVTNHVGLSPLALAAYSADATRLLLDRHPDLSDADRMAVLRDMLSRRADVAILDSHELKRFPGSGMTSDLYRWVELHLDRFRGFDGRSAFGAELLALAMDTGEWNVAELVMAHGVPLGARDAAGDPVLWRAFRNRAVAPYLPKGTLASRLFQGLPKRAADWLHEIGLFPAFPVWNPRFQALDFLAAQGFDLGLTNASGGTLLHGLARQQRPEELIWLLDASEGLGAIPGGPVSRTLSGKVTPGVAANGPLPRLVRGLREAGRDLEWKDRSGDTAWLAAWRHGHAALGRRLAALGANPKATNAAGDNVLHLVCRPGHPAEAAPDLDILIGELTEKGVDPNAGDGEGRTPLHHATGHYQAARLIPVLMKAGGNLDLPDRRGVTARRLLEDADRGKGRP